MSDKPSDAVRPPKRRKTLHACDYCRSHKLRCEYLSDPATSTGPVICKHCRDFGIECKYSKREGASKVQNASASSSSGNAWAKPLPVFPTLEEDVDPRYLGPTSTTQLVATIARHGPPRAQRILKGIDKLYDHHSVDSGSGDPYVIVPQSAKPPPTSSAPPPRQGKAPMTLTEELLSTEVIPLLLEQYINGILPILPILSEAEARKYTDITPPPPGSPSPSTLLQPIERIPLMGLALMTLTSMNRKNPRFLRSALLSALRQRMGGPEGLALSRTSSVSSIQTFLLLSLSPDIGSDLTNSSGSQSWLFVGQAIRMAFDIGLHRAMSARSVPASRLNRRSRVWAACIVLDRWYALYHGQPYTISLEDCDAPGPSPFDDDDEEGGWQNRSKRPYTAHVEMTKLAILIGRVLKTVYLPSGLKYVRREDLLQVEAEIDSWSNSRPISLRFDPDHRNSLEAGVLHALHACIEISFYRVFFPSKSKPPGPDVGFRLDRDRWHSLVQRSASALTWLNDRGEQLLDIWFGTVYAVTNCSLVQYYACFLGQNALEPLQLARGCLSRWSEEQVLQDMEEEQEEEQEQDEKGEKSKPNSSPQPQGKARSSSLMMSKKEVGEAMGKKKKKKVLAVRAKVSALVSLLAATAEEQQGGREGSGITTTVTGHGRSAAGWVGGGAERKARTREGRLLEESDTVASTVFGSNGDFGSEREREGMGGWSFSSSSTAQHHQVGTPADSTSSKLTSGSGSSGTSSSSSNIHLLLNGGEGGGGRAASSTTSSSAHTSTSSMRNRMAPFNYPPDGFYHPSHHQTGLEQGYHQRHGHGGLVETTLPEGVGVLAGQSSNNSTITTTTPPNLTPDELEALQRWVEEILGSTTPWEHFG